MGKDDISLKAYLASATRFADLWNGAVFGGKQVIKAEDLEEVNPLLDKADKEALLERSRDLVMCETRKGQKLAVWVVENQKTVDYSMPVRIMLQEALEYDRQVKKLCDKNVELEALRKKNGNQSIFTEAGERLYKFKQSDKLHPVVTLVVYWGEKEWIGPHDLHEMLDFEAFSEDEAKWMRTLIPKYPLHILELSSFEDTEPFLTELRHLFALYQRRNDKKAFWQYINENEQNWNMNDDTWLVLSNLTHSKRMCKLIKQKESEEVEMCKALDDLVDDAKAEGKAEMLIDILSEYGEVEVELQEEIMSHLDADILKQWIKIAVMSGSVEEFTSQMYNQIITV